MSGYINDLLKAFKTFFNYLKREGHIAENPTTKVKNMKQPKTKILTFSEDEIRRLLNHFGGKSYLALRNRASLFAIDEALERKMQQLCPVNRS